MINNHLRIYLEILKLFLALTILLPPSLCQFQNRLLNLTRQVKDFEKVFDENHVMYVTRGDPKYLRVLSIGFDSESESIDSLTFEQIYEENILQLSKITIDQTKRVVTMVVNNKHLRIQNYDLSNSTGVETVTPELTGGPQHLYTATQVGFSFCYDNSVLCFSFAKGGGTKRFMMYDPHELAPFSFFKTIIIPSQPFRTSAHQKTNLVATLDFSPCRLKLYDMTKTTADAEILNKYLSGAGNSILILGHVSKIIYSRAGRHSTLADYDCTTLASVQNISGKVLKWTEVVGTYFAASNYESHSTVIMFNYKDMSSSINYYPNSKYGQRAEFQLEVARRFVFMNYRNSDTEYQGIVVENRESILEFHNCDTFLDNMECDACKENFSKQQDGSCACMPGLYIHDYDICSSCHESCGECKGPKISDCTACGEVGRIVKNGQCVCAKGFFCGTTPPTPCHGTCLNCVGGLANQCIDCPNNSWLTPDRRCQCQLGYSSTTETSGSGGDKSCKKIENRVLVLRSEYNDKNSSIILALSRNLDIENFKQNTIFYQESSNSTNISSQNTKSSSRISNKSGNSRSTKSRTNVQVKKVTQKGKLIIVEISNGDTINRNLPITISILNSESIPSEDQSALFIDFPLPVRVLKEARFYPLDYPLVQIGIATIVAVSCVLNPISGIFTLFLLADLELFTYLEIDYPPVILKLFKFIKKMNIFNQYPKITPNFLRNDQECSLPSKLSQSFTCRTTFNNLYLYIYLTTTFFIVVILKKLNYFSKKPYLKKIVDSIFLILQIRIFLGMAPFYKKIKNLEFSFNTVFDLIALIICLKLLVMLIALKSEPLNRVKSVSKGLFTIGKYFTISVLLSLYSDHPYITLGVIVSDKLVLLYQTVQYDFLSPRLPLYSIYTGLVAISYLYCIFRSQIHQLQILEDVFVGLYILSLCIKSWLNFVDLFKACCTKEREEKQYKSTKLEEREEEVEKGGELPIDFDTEGKTGKNDILDRQKSGELRLKKKKKERGLGSRIEKFKKRTKLKTKMLFTSKENAKNNVKKNNNTSKTVNNLIQKKKNRSNRQEQKIKSRNRTFQRVNIKEKKIEHDSDHK